MTALPLPAPAPAPAGAGPRPLVIGLDLSLTSVGIAGADWADALRTRTRGRGHLRLSWLRSEISDRTRHADLVVVEGPSYGHGAMAGHHEMAGLWWIVTHDLWRRATPTAICPPAQRAMYVTGKGNAPKGAVREGVREWLGISCDGPGRYDKADAASLAALGLHWLGYPTRPDMPESHTRALAGVAWPTEVPVSAR